MNKWGYIHFYNEKSYLKGLNVIVILFLHSNIFMRFWRSFLLYLKNFQLSKVQWRNSPLWRRLHRKTIGTKKKVSVGLRSLLLKYVRIKDLPCIEVRKSIIHIHLCQRPFQNDKYFNIAGKGFLVTHCW